MWTVAVELGAYLVLRGLGMGGRLLHDDPTLRGTVLASHILIDLGGPPIIFALYAWLRRASDQLMTDLSRGGIFLEPGPGDASVPREGGIRPAMRRHGWIIGLAIAAAGTIQHLTQPPGWNAASALRAQLALAVSIPLWYALWMSALTAATTAGALRAAFARYPVQVHPFHPDGYGGFGPLRAFLGTLIAFLTTISALLAAAVGVATITAQLSGERLDRVLVVYVVGYLVIAPAMLMATIWPAHEAMTRARARFADGLAGLFARGPAPGRPDAALTSADLARLHDAQRAWEIVRTFPVWPFNPRGLRGALIGIMSPLFIGMIVEVIMRVVLP